MRNFIKRTLSLLLSAAVLSGSALLSGCGDTSGGNTSKKITPLTSDPAASSATSTITSTDTSSATSSDSSSTSTTSSRQQPLFTVPSSETSTETSVETSTETPVSSSPDPVTSESEMSKQPQPEEAHFTFNKNETIEPYYTPQSANIPVPSLSEALGRFSEIENKTPEGTPEQIVQTLMERNVLCFATLQAQCWTFDSKYEDDYHYSRNTAPIQSNYLKSAQQIDDLFYGTYVKSKTEFLIHYFDGSVTDAFYEYNGELYVTFSEILKTANNSFAIPTYAAIKSSSDNRIEFTRYYTSNPVSGTVQPNNYTFTAVKENGEWRLEEYIIDAPSYSPLFTKPLIQTARAGAPDIVNHAVKQAGNFGGEPYWSWYGFSYRIEWCAAFVSWCYAEAGMKGPFFCACNSEGIAWFKRVGQWVGPEYRDIAPGDCIFFDWDLNGLANHVGLVIGTDGEKVYTIEGNRSDSCHTFAYDLDDDRIFGYGLIDWNKYT
ncbi:MAG: CHAP domain-containing protein [Oscillospiraceae bacterium]|nr:CHAP domain-containing protein [Oscillospiraceae bacterium]